MRLADKVAVITGGGSGFGRECSQLFSEQGAKIVVADVDPHRGEATAKLVLQQGGEAIAVTTDVRDEEQVANAVQTAVAEFGKIDIMCANAGILGELSPVPIDEFTTESWNNIFAVNTLGVFYASKHAVRAFKAAGNGGVILATSSAASMVAYPNIAAYSASKGAVNAMVRSMAVDLGPFGIRANAICPTHGMSPNFLLPPDADVVGKSYEEAAGPWDSSVSPIPLKLNRPPKLRDNANVALFLVSDEAAYISGVCLPSVDGATLSRVSMFFNEGWEQDVVSTANS